MTINLQLPKKQNFRPTITVFGVGGAGGNAVSNMIASNLEGVTFVVANTDSQSLEESLCENRVQLGDTVTQGLGAGSYPEVGKAAAEESVDEILEHLEDKNMVFITAGLGGGTGTGAAPVVARLARERGILTVAVVTKPFHFEGSHRMRVAELGVQELQKYVDTLIVIPNQNLFRVADKNTTFLDAFKMADDVLYSGVRGITDLMIMPGMINLDFSDVRSIMGEMGKAMMGTGEAEGEKRSIEAAEAAIANPLLDNVSMKGARGVLINITGGADMTLFEVDESANRIREEVDQDANIIFGSTYDKEMQGKIRVSVVATGIDSTLEERANTRIYSEPVKEEIESAPESHASFAVAEEETDQTVSWESSGMSGSFGGIYNASSASEEVKNEDSFISPEPVEPKNYEQKNGFLGAHQEGMESAMKARAAVSGAVFGVSPNKPSRGILGSLFGRKTQIEEEQIAPEQNEEPAVQKKEVRPKNQERDILNLEDELDIPAFLRRKSS